MSDNCGRSFLKAITWRVLASLTTTVVAYIMTRDVIISLEIGSIEAVAKFVIYYMHERVWDKVGIGRIS